MARLRPIGLAILLLAATALLLARSRGDGERRDSSRSKPTAPPPTPVSRKPAPPPVTPVKDFTAETPPLPGTGSIAGRALRLDGSPAAGARVRAAPGGDEGKRVVATAGADGSFRIDGLAPGRWTVAIGGGGFGTRLDEHAAEPVAEVVAGGVAEVTVRGQELAVVAGRVVGPDGQPVAKAKVEVWCRAFLSSEGGMWNLEAATGHDGSYEAKNVTPGEDVHVVVSAEGLAPADRYLPDLAPGSRTVVDLALETAVTLDLLVVAADDGTPVREALVWIHVAEGGHLYDGGHGGSFAPDEKGRVHATGLRRSPVKVQIGAKGFVDVPDTVVDPTARKDTVEFRLVRASSISGSLLQADGTPVEGQWIRAIPEGGKSSFEDFFRAPDAHTKRDGSFRIEGVAAGRYRVGLFEDPMTATVEAVVEAGATGVVLRLPAGRGPRSVRVRIVDPEGRPVPQVRYRRGQLSDGGGLCSSSESKQHGKGEFTIPIEEDQTAFLDVFDPRDASGGRLPLGHAFFVVPGDATGELTVKLPTERTIEGRVVGPGGRPVEGARIEVWTVPGPGLSPALGHELIGTMSAIQGEFQVTGLGEGAVRLTASADGFVGTPARVEPGTKDVVLTLFAEVRCDLRVLDDSGNPVEGAMVLARAGSSDEDEGSRFPRSAATDAQGKVRLRGLEPNRPCRLEIFVPSGREDLLTLRREGWVPESTEVRLERACSLEGAVRVGGKPPAAGWSATIEAWRDGAWAGTGMVEPDGRFRIGSLPAGRYELRVFGAGQALRLRVPATAETGGPPVTVDLSDE